MKIVLFNKQEKAGGGVGVFSQRLKLFLRDRGHEVFEFRFSKEPENKDFIKLPYLVADKNTYVFVPSLKTNKLIQAHLNSLMPDLVYLPLGISTLDFYIPGLCKKLGIPVMGVWHGDISRSNLLTKSLTSIPFRIYNPVCRRLDLVHVFSNNLKKYLIKHGVSAKKVVVIPNGVDTLKYSPQKKGVKNLAERRVLFLGRLTWIKNPEILIKSFLKIADEKMKLVIVGTGDLVDKLKKKYAGENIIFTGSVTDETRKIEIIRSCDVFVLPSRYEGMSLALLECMACGLACVASDVASQKEMLNGAGVVIPLGKMEKELPKQLQKLLTDVKLRNKLGQQARKRVVEHYSQDKVFKDLEKQFVKLAKLR